PDRGIPGTVIARSPSRPETCGRDTPSKGVSRPQVTLPHQRPRPTKAPRTSFTGANRSFGILLGCVDNALHSWSLHPVFAPTRLRWPCSHERGPSGAIGLGVRLAYGSRTGAARQIGPCSLGS